MAEQDLEIGTEETQVTSVDDAPDYDIDKASTELGKSLGLGGDDKPSDDVDLLGDEAVVTDDSAPTDAAAVTETTPTVRQPPQSWAKDKHEIWAKLQPEAQEYFETREKQMLDGLEQYKEHHAFGKQMREVMNPYKAFLTAQGVDEPKAAQYLLNAHYRLTNSQPAEKQSYFAQLAKSYGIDLAGYKPADETPIDPNVKALQDKVSSLESSLTQREQATLNEAKIKVASEVETFAKDPKHQYFDECSEDIVALIQAGNTLEAAYEKAVYANPVTRAKEIARLQADNEKALRAKSIAQTEAARKAAGTNVRSRDTRKAPTEPRGTMEDTMRATLKEIRERTH
jgi:hypothetical protein